MAYRDTATEPGKVYNLSLLFAFLANVFQLVSVSLLFRYSDFVNQIGGNEWHLGWIVGISSVGAIAFRLLQGSAIDRFGAQWIWYICLVGQIAGLYWHLSIDSATGIEVYLARILYASSLAGTFGAWLSFVSLQAPSDRVAEVIGVVGSSGFAGMAIGPMLGDYLFLSDIGSGNEVRYMFLFAMAALAMALVFAASACRSGTANGFPKLGSDHPGPNPLKVIWHAKPGFILLLGALMGLAIGFPGTFLRPFAASLDIDRINLFFLVYNIAAFTSRLAFRRAPQILGLKQTIFLGYGFMIVSMLLYLTVESEKGLIWPALVGGISHSFLFPSIVTVCTEYFSKQDRGVATNLILAMYDLGTLVGMPMIGVILTQSRNFETSSYSVTVVTIASVVAITLAIYFFLDHSRARFSNSTA